MLCLDKESIVTVSGVNSRPGNKHSHLVQKQLIGTWAVLLKRGWVDQTTEEQHAIFAEVEHAVAANRDADARRTAIQILEVGLASWPCFLPLLCHPHLLSVSTSVSRR